MSDGPARYPKREPFFAQRFIRLLTKCCAAQHMGVDAVWLLTVIVTQEDAARYRRPVTFFNEQLLPILGFAKWDRLDRARHKCIVSGWLQYQPPKVGERRAAEYWVTIPDVARELDDAPIDEHTPINRYPSEGYLQGDREGEGQGEPQGDREGELSYLSPSPSPSPNGAPAKTANGELAAEKIPLPSELDREPFPAAWQEWIAYRRERRLSTRERTMRAQLKSLAPIGPLAAAECVNMSIRNGWQGIFPDKVGTNGKSQQARVGPGQRIKAEESA